MSRVNPLVLLRESAGLGVGELADKAKVTTSAVIRAEQGVYTSPPPKILETLWKYAPEDDLHDYGIFLADYHDFQRVKRLENFGLLDERYEFPDPTRDKEAGLHPFVAWRAASGVDARIAISKAFCVHPALVFKFEAQPHLCVSPPGELIKALMMSGYTDTVMLQLSEKYTLYRDSLKHFVPNGPVGSGFVGGPVDGYVGTEA